MAIPAFIARYLGDDAYRKRIGKGLTKAYAKAERRDVELKDLRAVVFSDHHRGKGDLADDFARCEPAYCAALGWYLEQRFELWLLGDVEELWENGPRKVMAHYDDVLDLERQFGEGLWRFYGNHDMAWRRPADVERFLAEHAGEISVREALRLVVTESGQPLGTLFFVHGHQGTIDSGSLLVPVSRLFVRLVWGTLQRIRGFANTSPATNNELRSKHDRAMAAWADEHPDRLVMVAGHTHKPVFPGTQPRDRRAEAAVSEQAYRDALKRGGDVHAERAARELAGVRMLRDDGYTPVRLSRPSYFNSGCCSFGDGDVTALELQGGSVRLVRWLDNDGAASPHELEPPKDLRTVFAGVTGRAPEPVTSSTPAS